MRLFELRRNPELNLRLSVYEFLRQYRDDPTAYLHTTMADKVGIYPRSSGSHDSPVGIYAFRLVDIWADSIERWNTGEYARHPRGLSHLPYHGGDNVFILRSDIPADFVAIYGAADLDADIAKLKKMFRFDDEDVARVKRAARTNLNFVDAPAGYLWGMTKSIAGGGVSEFDSYTPVNTKRWNSILRRLGHKAFNDPGYGFIHGAEPRQALFLTKSAFEVIDLHRMHKRSRIEIGGKTYQRPPKQLHMRAIPNTFFYNNSKEDFSNVRSWRVDVMEISDLSRFASWLPWNARGEIGLLVLPQSRAVSAVSDAGRQLAAAAKLDDRISIERLHIGGDAGMIIRRIPPDFPADKITYSRFEWMPETALDKVDPAIKAKLEAV